MWKCDVSIYQSGCYGLGRLLEERQGTTEVGREQWRIQKILVGGILSTKPQKFECLHQN